MLLILGSMPGVESLRRQQYYGHPRNAFWSILSQLLSGEQPPASYQERIDMLQRAGIALWDVLAGCRRSGSLDSSIVAGSEIPNEIPALLRRCPGIARVACNGKRAHASFIRYISPILSEEERAELELISLPSTSPAYASMSRGEKCRQWQLRLQLAPNCPK